MEILKIKKKSEKIILFKNRGENPIFLFLPMKENILQPELSSPPNFRIQGGVLRALHMKDEGRKSLCLFQD